MIQKCIDITILQIDSILQTNQKFYENDFD